MFPRPTESLRLGPYELIERIGKGGMGEVWKAHDSRLGREVAVKLSAEQFSDRFEKEARAIAALNHSNICTLFDVGPNYLVMELIDGPTLADRIAEGPIPLEESLAIAKQIVDALEAAHEKNIVHRDLKPGNIKMRVDGTVKVLDFGLAKSGNFEAPLNDDSPTMIMTTQAGVILGTAAYMAPEQARGKTVDKRADIWSFGVVLFEMVSGRRLFEEETLTETLAAVIKADPDLHPAPHKIRRLLAKCLEKDPKKRLRDIGDAWDYLDAPPPASPSSSRSSLMPWVAAALLLSAFAGLAFIHFRESIPMARRVMLSISLPDDKIPGFVNISPDGQRIILAISQSAADQTLNVRRLDTDILKPLRGTGGARAPFWSPDGKFIAFFADGKLKVIPADGGMAESLCDADGGGGGTWSRNGTILFSALSQVWRTSATGGGCTPIGKTGTPDRFPVFLPDGRHFFYLQRSQGSDAGGVYLGDLTAVKDGNLGGRRVLPDISSVVYVPPMTGTANGDLLFLRENSLMAQPFGEQTMQTVGEPFVAADQVSTSPTQGLAAASASENGTLAYITGRNLDHTLVWMDRSGKELAKIGDVHVQVGVFLSPDGSRVLSERQFSDGTEWWIYDLVRKIEKRVASRGTRIVPVWSPDGSSVWRASGVGDEAQVDQIDIETGQEKLIRKWNHPAAYLSDRSRDGRYVVFTQIDPKTQADIWYARIENGELGESVKLVGTSSVESQGQLSSDGKWLAYYSDESGDGQVYVRAFPSGGETWKVSPGSAQEPRWRADGKELYYLSSSGLTAVTVAPDGHGGLRFGAPQKLFDYQGRHTVPQQNIWSYSPSSDGKFLVNVRTGASKPSVAVILNWQARLKE